MIKHFLMLNYKANNNLQSKSKIAIQQVVHKTFSAKQKSQGEHEG